MMTIKANIYGREEYPVGTWRIGCGKELSRTRTHTVIFSILHTMIFLISVYSNIGYSNGSSGLRARLLTANDFKSKIS